MIPFLLVIQDEDLRNRLEEIYIKYKKDVYWVAKNILKDAHESEDVVQEAIIKISAVIEKNMDLECNKIKGLFVIIVRNLSINIYNSRKRTSNIAYNEDLEYITDDFSIEEEIIRLDEAKFIADALAKVNPTYADILTLKYYHEYSDSEISKLLNIKEGNVRARLMRARRAVKDIIEKNQKEADTLG